MVPLGIHGVVDRQCGCLGGIENCTFWYGSGYLTRSDYLPSSDARKNPGPAAPEPQSADPSAALTSSSTERSELIRRSVPYGGRGMRINELACELEIKPRVILDLLRESGGFGSKTHSSWLNDSLVLSLRHHFAADRKEGVPNTVRDKPARSEARPETRRLLSKAPAVSRTTLDQRTATNNLFAGHLPFGPATKRIGPQKTARARALASGKGHSGPAEENTDITQLSELENYWVERRRDGSRDYSQFRESGKFGSYPSYDDCGDESAP
jgi:hypothetical protein